MTKKEVLKLQNRDQVILLKSFDGKERALLICGDPQIDDSGVMVNLFDLDGTLIKKVSNKFLK